MPAAKIIKLLIYNRKEHTVTEMPVACTEVARKGLNVEYTYKHPFEHHSVSNKMPAVTWDSNK